MKTNKIYRLIGVFETAIFRYEDIYFNDLDLATEKYKQFIESDKYEKVTLCECAWRSGVLCSMKNIYIYDKLYF